MSRRLLIALALLLSVPLAAQTVADDPYCQQRETAYGPDHCEARIATVQPGDVVRIDGAQNGSIAVTGWDEDYVAVRAILRTYGEQAEARAAAVALDIEGTIRAVDTAEVEGGLWVTLEVRVPRASALDLTAVQGSIRIDGVGGSIRFRTANGSVQLAGVSGDVQGSTANGSIGVRLPEGRWQGAGLDVTTGNGSVRLTVPEGFNGTVVSATGWGRVTSDLDADLVTRDGRTLRLAQGDGEGPPVRVTTGNGSVRFERG